MNKKAIKDVLSEHSISPSKSLGQNFLIDSNIAQWIVAQLDITSEDCIIEVGPGAGSLTEHIAPLCRKLILIEFDQRLAQYQTERWADTPHVQVHHADGATWDPRPLFAEKPIKFIGNLPYSAGGAILSNFLTAPCACERAVVMLQKEFIDRIIAKPKDDAYGLLSLRMQMDWHAKAIKNVGPEAFSPQPRVDSTVMLLTPRNPRELPIFHHGLMDELMRRCFAQRRKQMHKQLPATRSWAEVSAQLGISPTARPEELGLEDWAKLTAAYDTHPQGQIAQHADEMLEVVSEDNQVLRLATRKEIHEQELMHRSVHVLVFNKNRDCYLQLRSAFKDSSPELWDSSAAGHIDAGESPENAAKRELQEELGISDSKLMHIASLPPCAENGWEHVSLYISVYTGKINYPAAEIAGVIPFPIDLINRWTKRQPKDFASSFITCWEVACDFINKNT